MKVITKKVKDLVEKNALAVATVMSNGKPNVIGVACVKVIEGEKLLITDNYMRQTVVDIQKNPSVAVIVWDKDWNGYKLIGKAKYFSRGEWVLKVKKMKENKGLPAKGAIVVKVSKVIKSA